MFCSNSIWLKDGQIVQTILKDNTNNKRVVGHRFLVDANGNLYIDNVRLEDDGKWQCEAEDGFGFVVQGKPVILTVLGKFELYLNHLNLQFLENQTKLELIDQNFIPKMF